MTNASNITAGSIESGDVTFTYVPGHPVRYIKAHSGLYFKHDTPEPVRDILTRYLRSTTRLRLYYGDRVTGRSWLEECGMVGTIGASMGPLRVPLLICTPRSTGGGAILDDCIVRIDAGPCTLYKHPTFHLPLLVVRPIPPETLAALGTRYAAEVLADGKVHARFPSLKRAEAWAAYMRGERRRAW